jgi:hypothetical protein
VGDRELTVDIVQAVDQPLANLAQQEVVPRQTGSCPVPMQSDAPAIEYGKCVQHYGEIELRVGVCGRSDDC